MQIIKDFQATWSLWAWKKIAKLATCNQKAIWLQNLVSPRRVTSRKAGTGIRTNIFTHYSRIVEQEAVG